MKPGEAVDLGTTMAELVDLDRLVVSAGVPSSELASLKVGQGAEVITGAASAPVAASLIFVGAEVDPKTGTAPVRVSLPARSDLRPGTAVTLRIVTEEHRDCLAAPAGSVVKNAAGETVLALVSGDRAVQRPVKTGLRDGDLIEVSGDGLQAGAAVVTEGAYGLPPETRVRIVGD